MAISIQSRLRSLKINSSYTDSRAITMLMLGISAGIPYMLFFSTLSLWLLEAGIEKKTVTMFSWAALGYSFKFVWSPLIDALPVPVLTKKLGKRRAWLLLAQTFMIVAIVLMASTDPMQGNMALQWMAIGAILLGFSSATQDIVIDAYRIELAPEDTGMQSVMSSTYVAGYRIGYAISGAGSLKLAFALGTIKGHYIYHAWFITYMVMAAIMGVCMITTLCIREPMGSTQSINLNNNQQNVFKIFVRVFVLPILVFVFGFSVLNYYLNLSVLTKLVMASVPTLALLYRADMNHGTQTSLENALRMVLMFGFCVVVFVMTFVTMGTLLPITKDPLMGFLLETVRLITAVAMATLCAWLMLLGKMIERKAVIQAWVEPLFDFFKRYKKNAFLLLALIGTYRISDIVAGIISNVFYSDLGFNNNEIADAVKIFGVLMSIFGGFMGGILAQRFAIMRMMMLGAIMASASNLLFVLLSYHGHDVLMMYVVVGLDNFAGGLAGTFFVAFLSALTSVRFTAVQYALFSSMMTLFPKILGGYSGTIVSKIGYAQFFILTALLGVPVLLLVWLANKRLFQTQTSD